jgi:hypothetical protein
MKKKYTTAPTLLCFLALLLVLFLTQNPIATAAKYANEFDSQKVKSTFYQSQIDNNQVVAILKTVRK